jgi:hypothetical protein
MPTDHSLYATACCMSSMRWITAAAPVFWNPHNKYYPCLRKAGLACGRFCAPDRFPDPWKVRIYTETWSSTSPTAPAITRSAVRRQSCAVSEFYTCIAFVPIQTTRKEKAYYAVKAEKFTGDVFMTPKSLEHCNPGALLHQRVSQIYYAQYWIWRTGYDGHELDRAGSGQGQVAGSCECGNEPSGSIKCGEFQD